MRAIMYLADTNLRTVESFNSDTPRKRGIVPRTMVGRQLPSDLPWEAP